MPHLQLDGFHSIMQLDTHYCMRANLDPRWRSSSQFQQKQKHNWRSGVSCIPFCVVCMHGSKEEAYFDMTYWITTQQGECRCPRFHVHALRVPSLKHQLYIWCVDRMRPNSTYAHLWTNEHCVPRAHTNGDTPAWLPSVLTCRSGWRGEHTFPFSGKACEWATFCLL